MSMSEALVLFSRASLFLFSSSSTESKLWSIFFRRTHPAFHQAWAPPVACSHRPFAPLVVQCRRCRNGSLQYGLVHLEFGPVCLQRSSSSQFQCESVLPG